MTVKQLKEKLSLYPETWDVFVAPRRTDFDYGLVNSCSKKYISFQDEPEGPALAKEWVVVLDEE